MSCSNDVWPLVVEEFGDIICRCRLRVQHSRAVNRGSNTSDDLKSYAPIGSLIQGLRLILEHYLLRRPRGREGEALVVDTLHRTIRESERQVSSHGGAMLEYLNHWALRTAEGQDAGQGSSFLLYFPCLLRVAEAHCKSRSDNLA